MCGVKCMKKEDWYVDLEEEDVYGEDYRESLLEDGELSPEEDAFMRGYEEAY